MRRTIVAIAVVLVLAAAAVIAVRTRTDRLGDLPYFPRATRVGSTTFAAESFGFPQAAWEQVELRSQATFEQVRDFYATLTIRGWTSTFESESPKRTGRVYLRLLADGRRRQFYVIRVEERQPSRDVGILLRHGRATQ
ncbi:MAG: hypothetical protein QN187_09435 [Armatimonadota bacterium]|nr:hypothetical protein [Armatimonadota bacterium]MDR7519381.1 hypothetical protein [Armatimonadota bacterium]MDR7549496.1 hypothetical protein [Armatimonadota bacterium]